MVHFQRFHRTSLLAENEGREVHSCSGRQMLFAEPNCPSELLLLRQIAVNASARVRAQRQGTLGRSDDRRSCQNTAGNSG
jgi:hypothetical protein